MLLRILGAGLGILFLIAVMLVIGSYTFLPSLVERQFASAIQDRLNLTSAPQITLDSEPQLKMLLGKFDSGRIVLDGFRFEGIRSDRTVVRLDSFALDLPGSIKSMAFKSKKPLSGDVTLDLSEQELTHLADSINQGLAIQDVRLEPDRMTVELRTQVMGVSVPASVVGTLKLRPRTLDFEPRKISAFGVPLPERLSDRLVSESGFEYPLDDLPYDTDLSDVRVESGKVVIEGTMNNIDLVDPDA